MLALRWPMQGYGYGSTGADVWAAYDWDGASRHGRTAKRRRRR